MVELKPDQLAAEVERLTSRFAERRFPELARALHAAVPATVRGWRKLSVEAMPYLNRLSVVEFENSIASTLHALANTLECDDPQRLHRLMEEAPEHGLLRFLQHCGPETILAEERILRSVVVIELRHELGREPTTDEAAALHDLLDLMGEQSLLAMVNKRREEHDRVVQLRVSGMHRLADLGMLVAGVAHDASNLLLPLRMRLEHLQAAELPAAIKEELTAVELLVKQFQNSIVNLRWLSIDSSGGTGSSSHSRPKASLRLQEWAREAAEFHRRMLPRKVRLDIEIDPELPPVSITSAALSQVVFNLIHNASQAITSAGEGASGRIVLRAAAGASGSINVAVVDDGPGMTEEVLRRSTEPFFTTRASGSGLGLALVQALVTGCGGSMTFSSPPPGKERGTSVVMMLPIAEAS